MPDFPVLTVTVGYHTQTEKVDVSGPPDYLHCLHLLNKGTLEILSLMEEEEYQPRVRLFTKLPPTLRVQVEGTFFGQQQMKIGIKGGDLTNVQKALVLSRGIDHVLGFMVERRHAAMTAAQAEGFPSPDTKPPSAEESQEEVPDGTSR